jgi:PAS domain S-box-containing protein
LFGIPCLKKDGSVFFADIFASPMIIDGKKMNVGFFTDVTERKTAEEKLKLSEEKFSKIFYTSPDAIGINRLHDGLYLDVNDGFTKITGYAKEELIGKTSQELSVWANPKDRIRLVNQLLKNKNVTNLEAEFRMKDGSIFSGSMSAIIIEINNEPCIISITRNITERKKIERDQKFFNQILLVLNGDLDLKKMIASVMKLVQEETKFSAVGIRLKQGDDFPYFDQIGFSNNFLLTENKLIAANSDGNICKDENGKPFLECTCGMVISEKINHSNQLLTKAGSFWTNDSYPLLELLPDQDPRFHPRNNCIHFGYGSVAIIPIRANNITIGTLQLNEKKKNAFTNETISFFETICLSIGNAFMRKQTEKLLTDSQHQLLTFMNESPLSIYFVNAKTMKIIYANPFFFNTLDYLQDEMNSISIFDFIHAPKAEVEKFLSDVYQTKESKTISRQWKKRDGEILDMLVNVSYVKQNETETLFISAQNISETQRLERQLQESHKVLSNIFKSLEKETFWSRDLITDKMLYISPGIEKLFGKPLEGFLHNQNLWSEVIHPEDRKKAAEALRNSNGKSFSQEYRIIMPDESIKWIHSSVIVSNENGKSVRADGSLYDITEIKLLNEQLNEKIKDMNMFIYRASHDLRGPLSTVMGLSELGKTEAGTNKQMNFYFDKISYSIGRLDNIIQELSKIGRITQVPIKIERINIKNEINEIINSLKSLPDFSKVKFTVDIETHDILTDKVFIIMALQNIIANAINYIDAKKSNHAVSIHAYEESGKNKIVISDNGIGIDNEIQDKVFDMFYRGSEQSSGSGLGLYIVKHTIQKLEGNIFLSSEKGKGTTFTIQLPKNINEEKWR